MTSIINLNIQEKIHKKQKTAILQNFTLEAERQEKIAIIGESGVGKTSLLNILGLLDYNYKGTYEIFNTPVNNLSKDILANYRNQKIGFILQDSALINSLTIEDNIKLPLLYANSKKRDMQSHFHTIVEKIGIVSILKKKPLECSGGQRSRAVFARGIMMNPEIILADEPTASLDSANKEHIIDLLFEMNKEFKSTIITVTHDLDIARRHDRIIKLERNA
ncbi:ABC transporter ATP-binding protein [Staphylococcus felis]|uniref:ABC transporter ATP-binding protein n=4 Tax=Staphylococcus felis TaxID=46127 RepID=UPI000E23266C|nr:ATP-binding cassette domain-containing protein [Staphylococcus felis]REI07060.1 ABC transporter ATP-binding protein [Staphylococcus felis]